jgi:hypothetical protein
MRMLMSGARCILGRSQGWYPRKEVCLNVEIRDIIIGTMSKYFS